MATKKITELVEIISAANDDVLPIVDISTDITNKIKVENLPISTSVQTALNGKENTIGYTTENVANKSTSVATDQASNTKYPSVKAVYDWAVGLFATLSQLATKQDTLVSGTNIKTINSTSLLGSGDISISANPSGGAGAIQFSNGSAFASDATNLFWDDTNNRLGIGTNTPSYGLDVSQNVNGNLFARLENTNAGGFGLLLKAGLGVGTYTMQWSNYLGQGGGRIYPDGVYIGQQSAPTARLQVRGSGTTIATTALLVQNSAGTQSLKLDDGGALQIGLTSTINWTFNSNTLTSNQYAFISSNNGSILTTGAGNGGVFGNNNGGKVADSGISNAQVASAVLEVSSTTRGFLPPRMTTTQKNAIATPASGLVVYDSTTNKLQCYNGSTWNDLF